MELWKDIPGYDGLYQVSNLGRVRSLNYKMTGRVQVLKLTNRGRGYLCVALCKDGNKKMFSVHRLVAEAFIPNPDNLPQVNHINEDKTDNRASNLEWCSAMENSNHGTRTERSAEKRSKPVMQFTRDGKFVREWPSTQECQRNGFKQSAVWRCCIGKKTRYKWYIWCWKELPSLKHERGSSQP